MDLYVSGCGEAMSGCEDDDAWTLSIATCPIILLSLSSTADGDHTIVGWVVLSAANAMLGQPAKALLAM
jgi:hypothetical protein